MNNPILAGLWEAISPRRRAELREAEAHRVEREGALRQQLLEVQDQRRAMQSAEPWLEKKRADLDAVYAAWVGTSPAHTEIMLNLHGRAQALSEMVNLPSRLREEQARIERELADLSGEVLADAG